MELGPEKLKDMYRRMVVIRKFEEHIYDIYTRGLMPGLAHLYIGEEAVAVGACAALRDDDFIASTHRGHGHLIAKGGRIDRMMAEVMGKVDGYCRGKGGSMHIADMSLGILGANGIVGGGLGIITGAALSARMRKTDQVALGFFGDGALNQGIFLETVNMAAIWKLPVIYLCENNQYGEYTAASKVTAGHDLCARAAAFDVPARQVDGLDILAVYEATQWAVDRARSGEGPSFLLCQTYRYRGHHVGDQNTYRTKEEIEQWMARDCIRRLASRLTAGGSASEADLRAVDEAVEAEVVAAVDFGLHSPMPDPREVVEHVFA
ncbi:MAG: thiamine pyrophosphate-dependent dehydrogenase E1 component subunit alpha [Planctomycetes bacterium]|nr:thiamine pyrophosphate-dependent dehydrogenase E1 component subunit alpha [Planctomycetota bacterium]